MFDFQCCFRNIASVKVNRVSGTNNFCLNLVIQWRLRSLDLLHVNIMKRGSLSLVFGISVLVVLLLIIVKFICEYCAGIDNSIVTIELRDTGRSVARRKNW